MATSSKQTTQKSKKTTAATSESVSPLGPGAHPDCLFCKIIAGQIPCEKVYEDSTTFAFLDIRPVNPGHTLVVHKHHHHDIFDTPEADLCELMRAVQKVAIAVTKATRCDGINIGMNNRPAAGQLVMHAHIHVMPRLLNDGFHHWPHKDQTAEQLKSTGEAIRQALK
jgi:histidine triad (HIT) family protein